jgi:hypothetical protein
MDRSRRVDYGLQRERLKVLAERWRPDNIIAEQNAMGQPIIEQLWRDGLRITPFTTTNSSKANVIEALSLAFDRGDIRIPNDPVVVGELVAYQSEPLASGMLHYGASSGQYDDTVMALAMAWTAISDQSRIVYSIADSAIVASDFSIPDDWPRAFGMEIRWSTTAVIWGAKDPKSEVLYLYDEYLEQEPPSEVAKAILKRGAWIPGLIDPQANGREEQDGQALMQIYWKLKLRLQRVNNPLEAGILSTSELMRSGRLKVFASLSKYLDERRFYRRDDRDQIIRQNDKLQDAARCLVNNVNRLCTKPVPEILTPRRPNSDPNAWM